MKSSVSQIWLFLNAYTSGSSGGDVCAIEVISHAPPETQVTLFTSSQGVKYAESFRKPATTHWIRVVTSRERVITHLIVTYVLRTITALFFVLSQAFSGLFQKKPPLIVYGSSDFFPDTLPALMAKVLLRAVWTQKVYHLIGRERRLAHLTQRMSLGLIFRYADHIFITDPELLATFQKRLSRLGREPSIVRLTSAGIDFERFKPGPSDTNGIDQPKYTYESVCLNRIHRSKGIFELVEIWAKVTATFPKAKLAVIGSTSDSALFDEVKNQVRHQNLEHAIDFLGFQPHEEVARIFQSSQVFVSPSLEEGFGMAPLEAMATGLPVVAFDLPVYHHTAGSSWLLAKLKDCDEFASHICRLLGDKGLRQTQSERGLTLVKRFDWAELSKSELSISGLEF